jgi:hypothetical protein
MQKQLPNGSWTALSNFLATSSRMAGRDQPFFYPSFEIG